MSDDYLSKAEPATPIEQFDEQSQTTTKKRTRNYSQHEMVSGKSGDSPRITKSDPTTYDDAKVVVLTPQCLKKHILDKSITAITTPFLLCFTGLPDSKKSTALNKLLQHFHKDTCTHKMEEFNERGIRFFELAAARRPPDDEIIYEDVKSLVGTSNGYALVVQSAIDHLYGVRGQFIKDFHDPSNVESERVYFDDDPDLNQHFLSILDCLSALNNKKKETENVPIWSQSLPSGISMINIWDIGLNKAVIYILPFLSGLLYNCHAWLFFDLLRDLPQLYELPDLPVNKYDPSRNDREYVMRWRARIHYLLRYAKLTESNRPHQKTCKLIASCTKAIESNTLTKKIEAFKKKAKNAAMQMQLIDFIDVDNINPFDQGNKKHLHCLAEMFDEIVHNQFKNPVNMPLSFVFLRSFFCETDKLYISKDVLKRKALALQLNNAMFIEFCQLFTSFGSIIDVSLIDSSSDLIILKPDVFFHELDKLFYPSPDIDTQVTTYGIVSESTATLIFGSKELSDVFMSFLTSIGLALKLESKVLNIPLSDQFAYYIPNVSKGKPILECEPTALHLLRDLNMPMSNFKVKFTDFFLKEYKSTILEMPKEPHINVTSFRAFPSNIPGHKGVIFELVYLGDAIEFRILTPYDHSCFEEICTQIITACHKIMPQEVKYNFAVMCSDDPNPKAVYKLYRNHHFLPNEDLCAKCISKGRHESDIFKIWNTVLSKDAYKVPRNQLLNGDPLTLDDTISLAKEMSDLSPQSLSCIAKHLFEDIFSTHPITEKLCLKTIFGWEGLTNEESSKRDLAIKLMKVAKEIHESNQDESKKLEAIARSLDFRVTHSMSKSGKSDQKFQNEDALLPKMNDYNDITNITDSLQEMLIVGKKVCQCYANTDNIVSVEDCGLTVIIPREVITPAESVYEITAQGLWGESKFEFPEGSKLISGVCHISVSSLSELNRPVSILLKHCANITDESQTKYLSFVIAKSGPPFIFEYLQGGTFSLQSQYGHISLKRFSLLAIVLAISGAAIGALATLGQPGGGAVEAAVGAAVGVADGFLVHPRCHYEAYIFYKKTGSRNWDMNFVVIQDHPQSMSLIEKRMFEYGTKDDNFRFCFTKDSLMLSDFPEKGELQGWSVMPKRALQIYKSQADDFIMSKSANPPYISAIISCNPDCANIPGYHITIKGADCQSFFVIKLQSLINETSIIMLRQAPDKNQVLSLLSDISACWYNIGLALRVCSNDLESIKTDIQGDNIIKLNKVIENWITTCSSSVSWQTLIIAIEGPIVNNRQKATEIRDYLDNSQ